MPQEQVTVPVLLFDPVLDRVAQEAIDRQVTRWLTDNCYMDEGDTYTVREIPEVTLAVTLTVYAPPDRRQRLHARRATK